MNHPTIYREYLSDNVHKNHSRQASICAPFSSLLYSVLCSTTTSIILQALDWHNCYTQIMVLFTTIYCKGAIILASSYNVRLQNMGIILLLYTSNNNPTTAAVAALGGGAEAPFKFQVWGSFHHKKHQDRSLHLSYSSTALSSIV